MSEVGNFKNCCVKRSKTINSPQPQDTEKRAAHKSAGLKD